MAITDRWHKSRPAPDEPRCRQHNLVPTPQHGQGDRWQVRYRDDAGAQRKKSFPKKDGKDPNTCASAFDAKIREQVNTDTYIDPAAGRIAFRQYAEQWRIDQLHHRPSTARQAESRLRLWVYPVIGDRQMSTIRRSDVQRVVTQAAAELAPSTVEVVHTYIASVFKAALIDRVIPSNPCVKIKLPEKSSAKVVPLTVKQVGHIAERVGARYRAMVPATGLRSGELRGLTIDHLSPALHLRSDVPPKRAVLRIDRQLEGVDERSEPVFGPVKTPAADRSVPVPGPVAVMLADHLATYSPGSAGLVFTTAAGTPVGRSRAGHIWRDAVDGMGLRQRAGWHDLRHHHASVLISEGLSVRAVADRLGHEDPAETLRTYAHLMPSDEERAVAATEEALKDVI
ncbi:site-specific recombinase XerD [Haloactinopolyspora alba]|uniref:Site-specific recombinase XerD n=1 Tax=Haloactinopolyspora alba TaxID=648780 RepID=A0A2P8E068_9ACTN|nr:site-specific integrase [Haloactinopolyspora alba]PSL02866.1 site-specific recombinase XerD [Haloactinopolyspora alba]